MGEIDQNQHKTSEKITMTTPQAEQMYLNRYLREIEGKNKVVYNPNDLPVEELPIIYGFNNGGSPGWFEGVLMSQDGVYLGGHTCSNEGYMPGDLGVLEGTRPDRHETFKKHYPNGYKMEFVSYDDTLNHKGLKAAVDLAVAIADKEKATVQ